MAYNGYGAGYPDDAMDIETTGPKVTVREVRLPLYTFSYLYLNPLPQGNPRPCRLRPPIHLPQSGQLPPSCHPSRSPHRRH